MINLKEKKYIWTGLGLLSILFHIYLIFSGLVPSLISRPLHMALAIPWVFIFISQNKPQLFLGYIFSFFGISSCVYIVINEPLLSDQYGFFEWGRAIFNFDNFNFYHTRNGSTYSGLASSTDYSNFSTVWINW